MGCFMSFYTYAHSSPQGKIFYIGKGMNDRAFAFSDRSHDWKRAVIHHSGVAVKILAHWDTEEEAFEHEKVLIECFKDMNYTLVNLTGGGKGPYGFKQSEETKRKKSLANRGFKHEIITCPKCQKVGGKTSMKRWHFENCTGDKQFKARITIDGKRIFLGNFESKKDAITAEINAYKSANRPLPRMFIKYKGIK
jgi:hypothetical protein